MSKKNRFVQVEDLTEVIGDSRFIVVGDVHACMNEFIELLEKIDFDDKKDYLIGVGDWTDRGYDNVACYRWVKHTKNAFSVCGNHDDRLARYLKGNPVQISHGLANTIVEFENVGILDNPVLKQEVFNFFNNLPCIIKIQDKFIVHAGFDPEYDVYHQIEADCLYMRYYGGEDYFDNVKGSMWYNFWKEEKETIFFGHTPTKHDYIRYRTDGSILTCNLDGGCVFGNYLRAYDSKNDKVYSVKANKQYFNGE